MKRILQWLKRHADEMGLAGLAIIAALAVGFSAASYLGVPQAAIDAVTPDGPDVPHELIDHADERAGLERGYQFGAEPAVALPRPTHLAGYTYYPSPNFSGRGACSPQAIVIHVTGPGSMAGMRSWFRNPASQVSAHFGVGKQGELDQYVPTEAAAWHAGILNRPDLTNPLIASWVSQGVNPNRCHIGIELLLGGPAEPLVEYPLMESKLKELLAWLSESHGIPLDRTHVIGHYQLDGVNRSTDPKCCVDIDRLLRDLAPPAADEYCCEQDYTGDGVWDGRYNITRGRWEWKPETLWHWRTEDPVWRCASGCP